MRYTRPREHLFIYWIIIVQDCKKCNSEFRILVYKQRLFFLMEGNQAKQMHFVIGPGKG